MNHLAPIAQRLALLSILSLQIIALPTPARAADPDPGVAVTQADVEKVLGAKFTSRSPEPGALFYEEVGGPREVHVYLWWAGGKNVEGMKPSFIANGETIDDVTGIGAAAMYRPQYSEVTVEIAAKETGDAQWLSISVHNVDKPADTKRLAIELAKRAAPRL